MRSDCEAQNSAAIFVFRSQLDTVVKIEITHADFTVDHQLPTIHVVIIAIYNRPHRAIAKWPAAREDAVADHRIKRLPILTDEEWCHPAFNCGDPPS